MTLLIVLDGQDCTGKTSLAPRLQKFLEGHSFLVGSKSFPEKTPFIQKYLECGVDSGITPKSFQTTCFLQKMDWQRTKEAQDKWWVLDRWGPSGTVYGFLDEIQEEQFADLTKFSIAFHEYVSFSDPNFRLLEKPAIGFILTCDAKTALERQRIRGGEASVYESVKKQERLGTLFKLYAMRDKSYNLIDTTDLTLEEVYSTIEKTIVKVFSL